MTVSADLPEVGELLAQRYRLDEHIGGDGGARNLWRGTDIILNRTVAVVVRIPGGEEASATMNAAVAASRVITDSMVSVYDAVDEHRFAYVVREWVEGEPLTKVLRHGTLPESDALEITASIADAVQTVHDAGIAHGHLHTNSLLLSEDDRIMVTEPYGETGHSQSDDVRALGSILYAALTGSWPGDVPVNVNLPAAPPDEQGRPQDVRELNPEVGAEVSSVVAGLVDPSAEPPSAGRLAERLRDLASDEQERGLAMVTPAAVEEPTRVDVSGEHDVAAAELGGHAGSDTATGSSEVSIGTDRPPRSMKRTALIAAGAACLALVVVIGGLVFFEEEPETAQSASENEQSDREGSGEEGSDEPAAPEAIDLSADMVRIVDPPKGTRTELGGTDLLFDGDEATGWTTDTYKRDPNFGNLKPGMGILVDLGEKQDISSVRVTMTSPGATVGLLTGSDDPGDSTSGDQEIVDAFDTVVEPLDNVNSNLELRPDGDLEARYIVVWITHLPQVPSGYKVTVSSIDVYVRE
ncbi:protein kinase family protein [Haloglycomyces albus]|uniref:protein kinase family protein n=1 Tax=Haloglycomyces albus TaxID=526067 RepID=UPI00046CD6ED|nr:protein kinase family protein [Haloglycomyces albus]